MSLYTASLHVVGRAPLLLSVAAALALLVGTVSVLDDGYAIQVLRGVAVLLGCALAATMDDPSGEVLAGSPYPRAVRSAYRLAAGILLVLPAWAVAAFVARVRDGSVPVTALTLEAAAFGALAVAVAAGLRAWRDMHAPSWIAGPVLLALTVGVHELPRGWALLVAQPWGPPWEAAHLRWAAVLLAGVAVAWWAWRDPWGASPSGTNSAAG